MAVPDKGAPLPSTVKTSMWPACAFAWKVSKIKHIFFVTAANTAVCRMHSKEVSNHWNMTRVKQCKALVPCPLLNNQLKGPCCRFKWQWDSEASRLNVKQHISSLVCSKYCIESVSIKGHGDRFFFFRLWFYLHGEKLFIPCWASGLDQILWIFFGHHTNSSWRSYFE